MINEALAMWSADDLKPYQRKKILKKPESREEILMAEINKLTRKCSELEYQIEKDRRNKEREINKKVNEVKRNERSRVLNTIKVLGQIDLNKWKVIITGSRIILEYKERIIMKNILYGDDIYDYPDDNYYIDGLKLDIYNNELRDIRYSRGNHPNIKHHNICIGDLGRETLVEKIKRLPKTLETGNLNSPFDDSVEYLLEREIRTGKAKKRANW
jgi:hypothetical protein